MAKEADEACSGGKAKLGKHSTLRVFAFECKKTLREIMAGFAFFTSVEGRGNLWIYGRLGRVREIWLNKKTCGY